VQVTGRSRSGSRGVSQVRARRQGIQVGGGLVPHTGIAARVRRAPTEHEWSGGIQPRPPHSDRLQGTNEGTGAPSIDCLIRSQVSAEASRQTARRGGLRVHRSEASMRYHQHLLEVRHHASSRTPSHHRHWSRNAAPRLHRGLCARGPWRSSTGWRLSRRPSVRMDWSDRRVALRRRRPDPTSPDPVNRLDSGSFRPAGSGVVLSNPLPRRTSDAQRDLFDGRLT